jgi:hypothetical protein
VKLKRRQIKKSDLIVPKEFFPDWFAVSPSMKGTVDDCEQKALYKYVLSVKPKQNNIAFLRGRCIHFVMERFFVTGQTLTEEDIKDMVTSYIANEVKAIVADYGITRDINPFSILKRKYKMPKRKPTKADIAVKNFKPDAFNFAQFNLQCSNSSLKLIQYVKKNEIKPLIHPVTKKLMVELDIKHPMVDMSGEILDTTADRVTDTRSIIDLVTKDPDGKIVLVDWKTAMQKTSASEPIDPTDTNNAIDVYAKALVSIDSRLTEMFPIKTRLVRVVAKVNGELPEDDKLTDDEKKNKKAWSNPEIFDKDVTIEDINESMKGFASASRKIKSLDLHRQKTWRCKDCEYVKLCLKGNMHGFFVYEREDEEER